ncbi:hypothetical protein M2152_001830 [Microbacteriaceae bacterium SG_E_30_P1]|uniref:GerMN domain-containing protein n=1 Tax=Antiquaquibacter oligotrophicus TaxID=2880260 RepID=A0ABT6KNS2_9MICO|nr:LpqB family beta-propeller domain-containing protein [Antiquaquibacter oligotrophicus]MDH6181648.1 hypothetical protein [Antiquaquibacter oligotrophicus]UDF12668.1 LpqB family beta-propeller domain-containing protein [Antiquaquibacter oligotrophicus]
MRRALGGVVIGVLLISGCAGIPTSGGVVPGAIIDEQFDPELVVLPSEPRPGSTQEDILIDFMLALRGPQSGYAIARQYLAENIADDWNPDESTIIRTGGYSIAPGSTENTLQYTFTSRAIVDSNGIYREDPPATQTLGFGFVQEEGEWRISAVPDGTVLSQSSFDVVFAELALYFFDPSYQYLVPDVRWFPSRATVTSRIVRELLKGPAPWLQQGAVVNSFPIATTVVDAESVSGAATVDLSPEALTASALDRDRMRQQLAASLDVATVDMTVGGIDLQTPPGLPVAIRNPRVESADLVGDGERFGFATGDVLASIPGISDRVVSSGATAVTLAADKQTAAMLTPGGVAVAQAGSSQSPVIDDRQGLVAPGLDPFRYVWSAERSSAGSLAVFEADGTPVNVANPLPADAQVVSLDVSRDGTRLLVYLSTAFGPKLLVAGIVRQQGTNAPTALGEPLELPIPSGEPVDATWVSDRSVATIARSGESSPVTVIEIGGPSAALSAAGQGVGITGGNDGTAGLRVLEADGSVLSPRGSGGWVDTGLRASFLGTKQ